jgi:hypothetical protein
VRGEQAYRARVVIGGAPTEPPPEAKASERMSRQRKYCDAGASQKGAQILPFRLPARRPARLPPVEDPLRRIEREEDRRRMLQNVAAALVIAFLLGTGLWLIGHLQTSARITVCLEAGHRDCLH